nr:hypothetical protein GCM10020092_045120 [Actinoplanes digitatis]
MTAISLAESGGNSRAHNPHGEDSRGLWQINGRAHPGLMAKYNLYDPQDNAKAAYEVSRHGADISPWTVTHGGSGARYLRHREEAQSAAVSYGDGPGRGVWSGTPGYGHTVSADRPGGVVSSLVQPADGGGNAALDEFLRVAKAQIGDRYVFGAEVKLKDEDPDVFDCSEFTQWAAHQAGTTIPDGATAQYLHLKEKGLLIPVSEAKDTPGALLFSFDREPRPGDGRTPGAHVAISLGDGRVVEAANPRAGVRESNAANRFEYAAVLPGISDGTGTPLATPAALPDPGPPCRCPPRCRPPCRRRSSAAPTPTGTGSATRSNAARAWTRCAPTPTATTSPTRRRWSPTGRTPARPTPTATSSTTRSSWRRASTRARRTATPTGTWTAASRRCRPTPTATASTTPSSRCSA